MGGLQIWHWVVIGVIIVVLFGSKRLPDAARGLGRSMRILKAETKGMMDDDKADKNTQIDAAHREVASAPAEQPAPSSQARPSQSPAAPRDTSI